MANVTYFNPRASALDTGIVTAADSTHVEISFGRVTETYFGSFTYAPSVGGLSGLQGGTLTGFQESDQGQLTYSMTDMNLPAVTVAHALLGGDSNALYDLIFSGSDSITGSIYGDQLTSGAGDDVIIALDGNDSVSGDEGNDDVNGNVGNDLVLGEAGADTVRGGKGDDSISGGDGDDPHVNGNIGNDRVVGGNGSDTVYGGQDNDTLYGEAGNDLLSGDLGQDILYGGAGADRFTIAKGGGVDWVGDFNAAEGDRIQLAPGTIYTVINYSGQVMIDLGGGDQLGLAGVASSSFSADWIVFG